MNLKGHKVLSAYFSTKPLYVDEPTQKKPNTRKLVEQPWQQTKAEMWDEVTDTLCNLDFIQAKSASGMVYELIYDILYVLQYIPDNASDITHELVLKERIDHYIKDLIASAKNEISISNLHIPDSLLPWTENQINKEIERIKQNINNSDRLKDFLSFLGQEAIYLHRYTADYPYFAIQQAWNYAPAGFVHQHSSSFVNKISGPLMLRKWTPNDKYYQIPALIRNLEGHSGWVNSISITPDAKIGLSASNDSTIRVWELQTGKCFRVLNAHVGCVNAVAVTPDGKYAVSGGDDHSVRVWDIQSGECIKSLLGHTNRVMTVCVTPDGRRAISGGLDKTIRVWDLQNAACQSVIETINSEVSSVATIPTGELIISGLYDSTLAVWESNSGNCLGKILAGLIRVNQASITPDLKIIVTVSAGNTVCIWHTFEDFYLNSYEGHGYIVNSAGITPDGKLVISAGDDKTIRVWNNISGKCLRIITGHTLGVNSIEITPDGRYAVSGSKDNTVKVWDIQKGQSQENSILKMDYLQNLKFPEPQKQKIIPTKKSKNTLTITNKTGEVGRIIELGEGEFTYFTCAPLLICDKYVACAVSDLTVRVWEISTGIGKWVFRGHLDRISAISSSPDGNYVISGSYDHTVRIWDLTSGECNKTLYGHANDISSVSIDCNGEWIISCDFDKIIRIWSLKTGQCRLVYKDRQPTIDVYFGQEKNSLYVDSETGELSPFKIIGIDLG